MRPVEKETVRKYGGASDDPRYSPLVALGTLEIHTGHKELGCVSTSPVRIAWRLLTLRMVGHQFPSISSAVDTS